MAVFVDKLLIALGIDPKGAEQGLDRVNHSVDRTDAKLNGLKHKAAGVAKYCHAGSRAASCGLFRRQDCAGLYLRYRAGGGADRGVQQEA